MTKTITVNGVVLAVTEDSRLGEYVKINGKPYSIAFKEDIAKALSQGTQLLTDKFIEQYPDFPAHMNALGTFVYYRTYSRFVPELGRRETWKETVRRATEYNVGLGITHLKKIGYPVDYDKFRKEAEDFFDSMFNLRQFLSGRTLWVGGAENGVADKYPLANFNCSFINIRSWDDLGDLFYLLLVGRA